MIQPGSTIGILGGGQLGRMLILAGRPLGFRFHIFEPKGPCCAGALADEETNASYDDLDALRAFAKSVDLITFEFENIPSTVVEELSAICPTFPNSRVLHICQNRQREKDFLQQNAIPCAPFQYADSEDTLAAAIEAVGFPCVIKTAAFGYDGKGQIKLNHPHEAGDTAYLWNYLNSPAKVVVEKWIHHVGEFSVVCARQANGTKRTFPMAENIHVEHILHASIAPARISEVKQKAGTKIAEQVADSLEVVGLIAVEFFLQEDGQLIVNELAPRPHNSGHYTIEGCHTSQFEQHIRAVAGLPFGSVDMKIPTVMINLLGQVWDSGQPDWQPLLETPFAKLHLYDKGEARSGRKMGHFTVANKDVDKALDTANELFEMLSKAAASKSEASS